MSKVLFIDDEQDLLEIAQSLFGHEGYEIDTVSSLSGAHELVAKNQYALIICDYKLSDGIGPRLIQELRESGSFKGKMLLLTGNVSWSGDLGPGDEVMFKPLIFDDLVRKVKELI
jgi:DNA-binding response OmpR family regulator